MKKVIWILVLTLGYTKFLLSEPCEESGMFILENAQVVDVVNNSILTNQEIGISGGKIDFVRNSNQVTNGSNNIGDDLGCRVDMGGNIVVPSFIDVHQHFDLSLGVNISNAEKDEVGLQNALSRTNIPYGITRVLMAGGPKLEVDITRGWPKQQASTVELMSSGGALTSEPTYFYNHQLVKTQEEIKKYIESLAQADIKMVKLYSNFSAEFLPTLNQAVQKHNMRPYAHLDGYNARIDQALLNGIFRFEHAKTIFLNVFAANPSKYSPETLPEDSELDWLWREFEIFRRIEMDDPKLKELVSQLQHYQATVTPTLAIYGNYLSEALSTDGLSNQKRLAFQKGFEHILALTFLLSQNGVQMLVGTDSDEPGKTYWQELQYFSKAGFGFLTSIKAATINAAEALGVSHEEGSIDKGKRANLLILDSTSGMERFDFSPNSLLSVIKDGKFVIRR